MRSLRLAAVLLCLVLVGAFVPSVAAHAAVSTAGAYYPLTSSRILDTRTTGGKLGAQTTRQLTVAGHGGVPSSGAAAVVVNLTVTQGTLNGFLAAYPAGATRPGSSSINYQANVSRANTTTVKLGTDGKINIYNSSGSVSVIVDVVGYYATGPTTAAGAGNDFDIVTPERLVDTRYDDEGILAADNILTLFIDFVGDDGVNRSNKVAAVSVNVTAVGAQGSGYLTAYDGGGTLPSTSTLNFPNGAAIANTAVIKTKLCTDCGAPAPVQFAVYNGSSKGVHVIVDLVGIYYQDGTVGLRYKPLTPVRIKDSRATNPPSPLQAAKYQSSTAPASAAGTNTSALVTNLTAVNPTASTYLTAWRYGATRPGVSNLNTPAGVTAANGAVIALSSGKQYNVFNASGTTHYLVDVVGQFNVGSGAAFAQARTASSVPRATNVHSTRGLAAAR